MSRTRSVSLQEALEVLLQNSYSFGVDKVVNNPRNVLESRLNLSLNKAGSLLRELEGKGAIALVKEGRGNVITSARIIKTVVSSDINSSGTRSRILQAMIKYSTKKNGYETPVLSASFFRDVVAEADATTECFYSTLGKLENENRVRVIRKPNKQKRNILYIVLEENFHSLISSP